MTSTRRIVGQPIIPTPEEILNALDPEWGRNFSNMSDAVEFYQKYSAKEWAAVKRELTSND